MNALEDFLELQRNKQQADHQAAFELAFRQFGKLPVSVADLDFAMHCTRYQLFALAFGAHASAMATREIETDMEVVK